MESTLTNNNTPRRGAMRGLQRSPIEQARVNLENALRVLAMAPHAESNLTPHPLAIVRAEIVNAQRYLEEAGK